jgi:ATP adenylyltransferase
MPQTSPCRLCGVGTPLKSVNCYSQPLWQSDRFVVVPSIGSLVPGWLLIVPRTHVLRAADLPQSARAELVELVDETRKRLEPVFGTTCVFEHGPVAPGCSTGCSVDHAHIHVVPVSTSLIAGATQFLARNYSHRASPDFSGALEHSALHARGKSYLLASDGDGAAATWFAADFPSQFFRRIVANAVGLESEFDWRAHPRDRIAYETVDQLVGS